MLEWRSSALILNVQPYTEKGALVSFFTQDYGIKNAFAYGVFSKKNRPIWQNGNLVQLNWKGKGQGDLGVAKVELLHNYATINYDNSIVLAIIGSIASLLSLALPEEDPCFPLFLETVSFLSILSDFSDHLLLEKYIRWELSLLSHLGFGLSVSSCILTGETKELLYVSPKTGCAVSSAVEEKWKDKLFRLPKFMGGAWAEKDYFSNEWGLLLTGHFLEKILLELRQKPLPFERRFLLEIFKNYRDM
ncbi:DNA repair protein RecO [Acetobacteraceae bacterium]|nr:DNA repair protein RecO [Acetobacteraceae bacterium]